MSRYSTRSYDYGAGLSSTSSSRYDSGSLYKSFDPATTGAYRSSNLTGYSGSSSSSSYGSGSRAGSSLYTSNGVPSSSTSSYTSSRSGRSDPALPRSTSFGRSEVLSSSTPRSESDARTSYSSGLGRSSSLPSHSQEPRSYRHSGRASEHSQQHTDAATTARQLRLAQRRRQREEAAYSETSSDNSKEPSVERASSLRRDSDSDSVGSYSRRYGSGRLRDKGSDPTGIQATSVPEEREEKESSAEAVQSPYRRPRRWRDGSWSSEDSGHTASAAADTAVSDTRGSARRRRLPEVGEVDTAASLGSVDKDTLVQCDSELKRSRRQQKLEASKQANGTRDDVVGKSEETSTATTSTTITRSWRQRLHESGVSGVSPSDAEAETTSKRSSYNEESETASKRELETSSRRRSRDMEEVESVGRRRSFRGISDSASSRDDTPDTGEVTQRRVSMEAAEVETRAERIARYKEERRKQLAHIASITSGSGSDEKEMDALPSLFTAAKREKGEAAAADIERPSKADVMTGGLSLTSRLRSLRRGSDEAPLDKLTTVTETSDKGETEDSTNSWSAELFSREDSVNMAPVENGHKVSESGKMSPEKESRAFSAIPSAVGRSSSPEQTRRHKSPASSAVKRSSSAKESTSSAKLSSSKDQNADKHSSSGQSSARISSESLSGRRAVKSPSPVSSRLMSPTKSSAAKETQSGSRGSNSPRSSPSRGSLSPRGSPARSAAKLSVPAASATSATKSQPVIKQTLMPERGGKEAMPHVTPSAGRTSELEEKGSKYMVRLPLSHKSEAESSRQRDKESPQRSLKGSSGGRTTPRLSSSSFSATSSTRSTDRDSGFGTSRLSSSSFSSTRSPEKETGGNHHALSSRSARLQRTPCVEISSSSSREGSEEKQVPTGKVSGVSTATVKRTSSMPSSRVADLAISGSHVSNAAKKRSSSLRKDRTASSSSQEGVTIQKQSGDTSSASSSAMRPQTSSRETANIDSASARSSRSVSAAFSHARKDSEPKEKFKADYVTKPKPLPVETSLATATRLPEPALKSPPALDDLLAKNAEYLSSDEDVSGSAKDSPRSAGRRRLQPGEEPKLRRSLRRRLLQKPGSDASRDDGTGPATRESKEGPGKEVVADVTATITLPTARAAHVEQGGVVQVSSDAASGDSDASSAVVPVPAKSERVAARDTTLAVRPEEGEATSAGRKSEAGPTAAGGTTSSSKKNGSPESDSVFETAPSEGSPSAPSSVEVVRRRRKDKSALRKSDLNKAVPDEGSSQASSEDVGRRKTDEVSNSRSKPRISDISFTSLASKVSDIRNRFAQGLVASEKPRAAQVTGEHPLRTTPQRSSSRGKEFSQLLQKFSTSEASSSERSDSDTAGGQRHRIFIKRQEARGGGGAELQSSSDDAAADSTRRAPARTQSLKVTRPSARDEARKEEKGVERSGSFKSDFMRRRFSPVRQTDAPSEELSTVLSRRHQEVDRQLQDDHESGDKRGDTRLGRAETFRQVAVEEVIADNEVAAKLKARRKETDSAAEQAEAASVSTSAIGKIDKSLEVLARVTHDLHEKENSPDTERLAKPAAGSSGVSVKRQNSKEAMKEAEQLITDVETRISSSLHLGETKAGDAGQRATTVKEKSPSPSLSYTVSLHSDDGGDKKRSAWKDEKETSDVTFSLSLGSDRSSSEKEAPERVDSKKDKLDSKSDSKKDAEIASYTLKPPSSLAITTQGAATTTTTITTANTTSSTTDLSSPTTTITVAQPSPLSPRSPTGIRRAESLKEQSTVSRSESFERKKGILKRTPSMPKQESGSSSSNSGRAAVDPQLARIMQQRRQKEMELEETREEEEEEMMAEAGSRRPRALSAAEEIEQNVRLMKETQRKNQEEQTEEEAALCMPVSQRIFKMQSKIEEERHTPVTPKSRSGAATPKSARSWSGSITPGRQVSVDEGVSETIPEVTSAVPEELSGPQLMEKLSSLAAKSQEFQQRRLKFQKRPKEDWRTRTQPVTMEEIQEADSLDSVSAFRALVRRKASKNVFEQLKSQEQQRPPVTKATEFPQHLLPDRRKQRRGRLQRHKTLPVTAEELNAVPEGELAAQAALRDPHEVWKRDSRTDSGILSGSEAESLASDSLRSLSLEMDVSDTDPSRMSVSSKASLFRHLDERAKAEREKEKSASGAKRYIDRKKRERSRTQPVTDDEVKTAAEFADKEEKSKQAPQQQQQQQTVVKMPQPEVVNRPKSPSVDAEQQQQQPEEEDQLIKLSLAEKVMLFQQQQEAASKQPPPRTEAPAPRRRQRKHASRFNTQPVTPEELEKASKISPLAMSLVKPPDPELLKGLPLKDQQELMMLHAEATLSQCSSRSGSRPSSQPGSRRGSFATPDTLAADSLSLAAAEKASSTTAINSSSTESTTVTTTTSAILKKQSSEMSRTDSEPRGILKKTKSTESVPSDSFSSSSSVFRVIQQEENVTVTTSDSKTIVTRDSGDAPSAKQPEAVVQQLEAVVQQPEAGAQPAEAEGDRYSPVAELVLPKPAETGAGDGEAMFYLQDDDLGGETSTDAAETETYRADPDSKRRSHFAGRKEQKERYLTQPAPELTPERSPQPKRKFKYEGRHMTQPITPDEMKEAEFATTPVGKVSGGSIADRLNQLKTSGEEEWKKRVSKDKLTDLDTPILDVKLREKKGLAAVRPTSIADRISKIGESAEQWRGRVEEKDAKEFTVATKLARVGSGTVIGTESPLVAKLRASKKDLTKLDDSSNTSSPVTSPSTPTKEFLPKVPLPKEIVVDPAAAKKAEEASKTVNGSTANGEENEAPEPVRVEVPTVNDEEIEQFFATKEISEISDKVDVNVDDFDNIFIEANEILQSVRKIRPTRKKKATSRNPLKTVSQFVEIQTEYIQVTSGTAEKELRRMKTEGFAREAGLAQAALAGLASKENFSKVSLRKTDESSVPVTGRHNPFQDLMLLHVKGRKTIQTRIVEPHAKSMNAGDCFILVTPDKVINWVGAFSNIIEKAKSAEIASFIQQKRDMGYKSTAAVATVEQAKDHLGAGKHFWAALNGDKECQASGPDEEDELYESSITKTNMIYRLADGALQPYEQYWGAIPRHEMLNEKEVLVFDFGSEFYVWQGKAVAMQQRKQSMALATKLWDKGYDYSQCALNPLAPLRSEEDGGIPVVAPKRPDWAIFGKVNQNMETIVFREKFADWPDTSRLIGVKGRKSTEMKSEFVDIKAYDAAKMIPVHNEPVTLKLEGADVGRGKKWAEDMQGFIKEQDILTLAVKVWHVMEYDHYLMPEDSYGQFHNGDTYVVRWQYMITNAGLKSRHSLTGRERCAYFFWQGKDSTINEKGASALMTVELDEERGPQVRVVQGKEPPCFLNLFEGHMTVHVGKREDASTNTPGPWRMYCLRGDTAGELCLLEIPVSITHLRSQSSLILLNVRTGIAYVWHGVKSPSHNRELAVSAMKNLKQKRPLELDLHEDAHIVITEVEEGEEKSEIWSALDSRDRKLYHSLLSDPACNSYTPRLFYMTSVSMVFEVTEQLNPARLPGTFTPFPFFQSDLYKATQPALFLLDIGSVVYLWQGWWPTATEDGENVHTGSATSRFNNDRRCAMETTLNYCKARANKGRTPKAYLVAAGVEPLAFQNLFPYWEPDSTIHALALEEGKHEDYCELVEDVYTKLTQTRYSLQELQERPLPDGVDPLKLESYLSDEEFEEVLDMKKEEFYALPTWKQSQVKQSLGLF